MILKKQIYKFIEFIGYSHIFNGLCAIVLINEIISQLSLHKLNIFFLLISFTGTILFYTYPLQNKVFSKTSSHPKIVWYAFNSRLVKILFIFWLIIFCISISVIIISYKNNFLVLNMSEIILLLSLIIISFMYYNHNQKKLKFQLRKIGWLKPLIIAYVWAGSVSILPLIYSKISNHFHQPISFYPLLLFIINFIYISIIAILFDFKDYKIDKKNHLKTIVIRFGIKKIFILLFIFQMILGGLILFKLKFYHKLNTLNIMGEFVPYFSLTLVILSLKKERSLLYYLVIVDGVLFIKGLIGQIIS